MPAGAALIVEPRGLGDPEHPHRNPYVRVIVEPLESLGQNADDGEGAIVQHDGPPDGRAVAAKFALPERI